MWKQYVYLQMHMHTSNCDSIKKCSNVMTFVLFSAAPPMLVMVTYVLWTQMETVTQMLL